MTTPFRRYDKDIQEYHIIDYMRVEVVLIESSQPVVWAKVRISQQIQTLAENSDHEFEERINKFKTKFTKYRVNDSYKKTVENDLRLCCHIRVKNEKNRNFVDKQLTHAMQ